MRLATFTHQSRRRIGAVVGDEIVDLSATCPDIPPSMRKALACGPAALDSVAAAIDSGAGRLALADVTLNAVVRRPRKFLGLALNYADHIRETGRETPKVQVWFNKQVSCLTGPYDPIVLPPFSTMVDYEGELAFIIGRKCRHVPEDRATEVIAGYTIVNDVTVRDWQLASPTMMMGKGFDTHGPTGPWIVTGDEIGDPHNLKITTTINGEILQAGNTSDMIFNCFQAVAHLSRAFTLYPGDIVTMGTPAGVGIARTPQRFLKEGDVVRVEIEKIGALENPVVMGSVETLIE